MIRCMFIITLFVLTTFAQSDLSSSVDVKQIVRQQIEEARKKELEASTAEKEEKVIPKEKKNIEAAIPEVHKQAQKNGEDVFTKTSNFITNNPGVIKYAIIIFFSIIVTSFVAVRRVKLNKKPAVGNDFKTNIKLVREEKFIKPIDPDLKKIRTNLCLTSRYLNTSDQFVTETAKKLNLAKTEIMLAAKFSRNQSAIYN